MLKSARLNCFDQFVASRNQISNLTRIISESLPFLAHKQRPHTVFWASHGKTEQIPGRLFVAYICNLIRSRRNRGKIEMSACFYRSCGLRFNRSTIPLENYLSSSFRLNFSHSGWLMPGVELLKCFPQLWLNTNFNPSSRQIYQNCVCLIPHDRRCLELGLSESKVNVWTFSCRSLFWNFAHRKSSVRMKNSFRFP